MKLIPAGTISEHVVEDQQKLSHAGGDSHLVELTCIRQALEEYLDDGVEANGHGGSHIQHLTHSDT